MFAQLIRPAVSLLALMTLLLWTAVLVPKGQICDAPGSQEQG